MCVSWGKNAMVQLRSSTTPSTGQRASVCVRVCARLPVQRKPGARLKRRRRPSASGPRVRGPGFSQAAPWRFPAPSAHPARACVRRRGQLGRTPVPPFFPWAWLTTAVTRVSPLLPPPPTVFRCACPEDFLGHRSRPALAPAGPPAKRHPARPHGPPGEPGPRLRCVSCGHGRFAETRRRPARRYVNSPFLGKQTANTYLLSDNWINSGGPTQDGF